MMTQYNAEGEAMRSFEDVISASDNHVEYARGEYRTRIYANTEAGEYFADPDKAQEQQEQEQA